MSRDHTPILSLFHFKKVKTSLKYLSPQMNRGNFALVKVCKLFSDENSFHAQCE